MNQEQDLGKEHLGLSMPVALTLIAAIRRGKTRTEAAAAVGVKPSALEFWIATSRAGYQEYAGLAEAIDQAEHDYEIERHSIVWRKVAEVAMEKAWEQSDSPPLPFKRRKRKGKREGNDPGRRERWHQ